MKTLIQLLRTEINLNDNNNSDGRSEIIGSVFFIFISMILTALNVIKHVEASMTIGTSVLVVGFAITALLAYWKKIGAARVIILVLCGSIFTMFALSGGNDGFAILWILLVPIIGPFWVGLRAGVILGMYFLVFLAVLFYTPASAYVADYYSQTFLLRFPLLFLATYGSSTFLMWQREVLINKLNYGSYYDSMTGLLNRRSYSEAIDKIKKNGLDPQFMCFSFDLNGLKYANDNFGHNAGDELIKAAADIISKNFRGADCYRTGGDEYFAFARNFDAEKAIAAMKEDASKWSGEYNKCISISVGYASVAGDPGFDIDGLSVLADERMYADKESFYANGTIPRR